MLNIRSLAIRLLALLIAFTLHEFAHAFVSYSLGDRSAGTHNRLTINPLAHIDWMGLLCLFAFGFGWGKPVTVDPRYYKDPKNGMVWTAFAGPVMNFILGFVCIFFYYLILGFIPSLYYTGIGSFILDLLAQTAYLSIGLGIFNCIPIPPLDGSKVLFSFLDEDKYFRLIQGTPVLSIIFIAILFSGVINAPIYHLESSMVSLFSNISMKIMGL